MRPGWWLAVAGLLAAAPAAGQSAGPRPAIALPADTLLSPATHWPLHVAAAGATRITIILFPVAPDTPPLHVESHVVHHAQTFWPLQGSDGAALEPGVYRLQIVSQDSASGFEATRVRVLAIERLAADTQAHPPALDRGTFLPESTLVTSRRPGFLLIAGIGVASLATAWTFDQGGSVSPITVAVPGALAIGGLVGFLRGRRVSLPVPANVAHNRELVTADIAARQAIVGANAQARAGATVRVRVIDQP